LLGTGKFVLDFEEILLRISFLIDFTDAGEEFINLILIFWTG
jgi:hypothetical protein